jgi:hypothetical protein
MASWLYLIIALIWGLITSPSSFAAADAFATASDGRFVILKDNGTWRLSTENDMPADGKVVLSLTLLEEVSGGCRGTFGLENWTHRTFPNFLPVVHLLDANGMEVGRSRLWLGEDLHPHGPYFLTALVQGRPCWAITRARVSGFEGYCRTHEDQCESVLFVHPNLHLPISPE